jgi:hypothetical protein
MSHRRPACSILNGELFQNNSVLAVRLKKDADRSRIEQSAVLVGGGGGGLTGGCVVPDCIKTGWIPHREAGAEGGTHTWVGTTWNIPGLAPMEELGTPLKPGCHTLMVLALYSLLGTNARETGQDYSGTIMAIMTPDAFSHVTLNLCRVHPSSIALNPLLHCVTLCSILSVSFRP